MFLSQNPYTGEIAAEFPYDTAAQLTDRLSRATAEQPAWAATPLAERQALLHRVADIYRDRREELATLATEEMGKPIRQSRGEIGISERIFRYYADEAERMLAPAPIATGSADEASVVLEPLGVLLGVMPWNYPFYQVARFVAPNLLLGNAMLLKHASNCPRSALAIEEVLLEAGLPEGVYANVFASHEGIAELIADPRVQAVSFTGSEAAGSRIAQTAAAHLKKSVLELGGNDPLILWGEESYEAALSAAASGRLSNAGQACTSPKRVLVQGELFERFVADLSERFASVTVTDPREETCELGPLSSARAATEILEVVEDARAKGARIHCGGVRVDGIESALAPTVISGVEPGMRAYAEEIFGPVATVLPIDSVEQGIALANDTPYGLGAAVFAADTGVRDAFAAGLQAGMVYANMNTDSEPHLPFGGIKRSGHGRELGEAGIREFANQKLYYFRPAV